MSISKIKERHESFCRVKEVRSWKYVGTLAHKDRHELLDLLAKITELPTHTVQVMRTIQDDNTFGGHWCEEEVVLKSAIKAITGDTK